MRANGCPRASTENRTGKRFRRCDATAGKVDAAASGTKCLTDAPAFGNGDASSIGISYTLADIHTAPDGDSDTSEAVSDADSDAATNGDSGRRKREKLRR